MCIEKLISPIEEEINEHTKTVRSGRAKAPETSCPACSAMPDFYILHDKRERKFRIIVNEFVKILISLLARWKCPLCKATFTDYPPFALPFKRYVLVDMLRFVEKYLENDKISYRQAATHDPNGKCEIFYDTENNPYTDGVSCLSHTSIWRWICFFGTLHDTRINALDLIKQKSPDCGIFREVFPVPLKKYRSEQRRIILVNARQLLKIASIFKDMFNETIFPRFGTMRLLM